MWIDLCPDVMREMYLKLGPEDSYARQFATAINAELRRAINRVHVYPHALYNTPKDRWSIREREMFLQTHDAHKLPDPRWDGRIPT